MLPVQAAALWIGLNMIFLVYISFRVGQVRTATKTSLGDGGDERLIKAIRTQGNYIEYAPAALLGLFILATLGVGSIYIHALGALFLLGRIFHLMGLGMGVWPQGRMAGTALTMLTLFATALTLLMKAFS